MRRCADKAHDVATRPHMTGDAIISTSDHYLMPTYARTPVAFVRGEGARLWDAEGREYLDFFSALAVTNLGHAPRVVDRTHRARDQPFGFCILKLEPRVGADPHRHVGRLQSTVGGTRIVAVRRKAHFHALAEPVVALPANGQRVELVEPRRVLVTYDEIRLVAA